VTADATTRLLVAWGEAREDVRALLLTSTRARYDAATDVFSDHDVIVVSEDARAYREDESWLADFGRVLARYCDPVRRQHGYERFAYITQYEDGRKIDFTFWPVGLLRAVAVQPTLPDELDVGYTVLLDKDGLAAGLAPPTYRAHIPPRPSAAEFAELVELFFHEATYVAKHLWRDDLLPAKYNLDQMMKQEFLRRLLVWRVEMDHGWNLKPGAYGKGLKRLLPPGIWEELARTYVGADVADNWEALFRTIALFRRVGVEVAGHLGYAYPHDLDRRAVAYLRRVRALPPDATSLASLRPEGDA
jgi:aminoglycoside 6-adenylyltransferase